MRKELEKMLKLQMNTVAYTVKQNFWSLPFFFIALEKMYTDLQIYE